jgi:hypothetical protein
MTTTRRDFLAKAAALPAIFGLPLAGCGPAHQPPWVSEALAKIRAEGRLGLAVRLPKDPDQRCRIGHRLTWLQNSGKLEDHEVVADLVVLCFEEEAFHARFGRRKEGVLLIDGDGYALDAIAELPQAWDAIGPTLRTLIDGADGARGRERAEAARRRAAPDDLRRIADPKEADVDPLAAHAGVLLPLLVAERTAAPASPRAKFLTQAIAEHFESIPQSERGPRLPYGIELAKGMRGGCGNCGCEENKNPKMAVGCGMGRYSPTDRSFVKFLAL